MGIKNGVPDSNLQGDHTPVKESWLVNLSDYNLNYKSVCSDPRLRKDFAAELANIKRGLQKDHPGASFTIESAYRTWGGHRWATGVDFEPTNCTWSDVAEAIKKYGSSRIDGNIHLCDGYSSIDGLGNYITPSQADSEVGCAWRTV